MDIESIKKSFKNKKKQFKSNQTIKPNKKIVNYGIKIMVTIVLTLITLIILKPNPKLKAGFYKYVYEANFSFAVVNNLYKKVFGSNIPFQDYITKTEQVFNEKLVFKEVSKYKDGAKLTVDENYLVPAQLSGIVIFVGEKDGYGKTVIIEQTNGIAVWYGNIKDSSVALYDYIETGKFIGTTESNILYLVYKKDGEILDYEEYI